MSHRDRIARNSNVCFYTGQLEDVPRLSMSCTEPYSASYLIDIDEHLIRSVENRGVQKTVRSPGNEFP